MRNLEFIMLLSLSLSGLGLVVALLFTLFYKPRK